MLPRPLRRAAPAAVTLFSLVALACGDDGDGVSGPTGPEPPAPDSIAAGTVVVDSTVMTLVSDSAQVVAGDLHFEVLGEATPPEIQPGNVLVGAEKGGFLRRVRTVSVSGSRIETTTADASLSEVIINGSFSARTSLGTEDGGLPVVLDGAPLRRGVAQVTQLDPDAVLTASGLSFKGDLCDGGVIQCPVGLKGKLILPAADITFNPDFEFGGRFEDGELAEFQAIATGDLTLDANADLGATGAVSFTGSRTLITVTRPTVFSVGPVPIAALLKFELKLGFTVAASDAVKFSMKVDGSANTRLGAQYTASGGWEVVNDLTTQGSASEPTLDGKVSTSLRIFLTPSVSLIAYGVAGPFVSWGPFGEGKATLAGGAGQASSCGLNVSAGMDGKVGIQLAKIDKNAAKWDTSIPGVSFYDQDYPCLFGAVQASVTTTGANPDPDGYTVGIGDTQVPVEVNGSALLDGLLAGTRSVTLTGVSNQCVVNQNPRNVTVVAGQTTPVSFVVECGETTGTLQVTTTTTGTPAGGGNYTVSVDGTQTRSIPPTGSVSFEGMAAGERSVALDEVPENCTVEGDDTRPVTVQEGQTATVAFAIQCVSNDLTVRAETTGEQPDPDGYTVVVDDGAFSEGIGVDGVAIFGELAPGSHTVELTGVAANCSVAGHNPRTVQLEEGGSEVVFQVLCQSGSLVVDVSTQGDPGVDTYTLSVDGTDTRTVLVNSSTSFTGLSTGEHSVALGGVPDRCAVLGDNPRTVDVPGSLAFSVDCSQGTAGLIATVRYAPGTSEIWTMNEDGLDAQRLLGPVTGTIQEVVWSRGGSMIAYKLLVPGAADPQQLWVANADGSGNRKLVSNDYALVLGEGWSPDGTEIAIVWAEAPGGFGIQRVKVDGSGMTLVPNTGPAVAASAAPAWSPTGSRIAFWCEADQVDPTPSPVNDGICIIDLDGSGLRVVDRKNREPGGLAWSPDGTKLAYHTRDYQDKLGGLWILRADTWTSSQLTTSDETSPTWSPDGATLAVQRPLLSGGAGIYVLPSDGGGVLRISTTDRDVNPNWRWR